MSSDLANIYANLLKMYGENYTIIYNTPPTYLISIVGSMEANNKIVLLCKEEREKAPKKNTSLSPSQLKKVEENVDLNLTGSPLKDDCVVDAIADMSLDLNIQYANPWRFEEEWQRGISVDEVRSLICKQDFQMCVDIKAEGAVWFLCNANDHEHTVMLQYEFSPMYFSRGIVQFLGLIPAYMVNTQTLVKHHYELIKPTTPMVTFIENAYNIKPNILLRCSWSTMAALPILVDLNTCDVMLKQTFRVSECGSLTEDFMTQLRILTYIRNDIVAYHKAEELGISSEPIYRCGCGIGMDELRENINKLLTEVSGFGEIDSGSSTEFDLEDVLQRTKMRHLTDLTDKLWDILRCCSTYKELKVAFNILFQCAARRNIVNTPTNKNRLAEIITELANHRLAVPCLSGVEPLELLLEIGLEKLAKDYEYIFTESKICSANLLKFTNISENGNYNMQHKVRKSLHNAVCSEPINARKTLLHHNAKSGMGCGGGQLQNDSIIEFKNSHFDEHESAAKIGKLLQIHFTLEHILMMHINLNLSKVYRDVCDQLLKCPVRIVDSIDDSLSDVMDIQLSINHVRPHLEGKEPHARRIIMKCKNKFHQVKSTYYYNVENVCPPHLSERFQYDEKEMTKEPTYYSWLYRKIKTLRN